MYITFLYILQMFILRSSYGCLYDLIL